MPKLDYDRLINLAVTDTNTVNILTSKDPEKIDELLTYPVFNFTDNEIDFLVGVKAENFKDFVKQTEGYWK